MGTLDLKLRYSGVTSDKANAGDKKDNFEK